MRGDTDGFFGAGLAVPGHGLIVSIASSRDWTFGADGRLR
jgi:hypothetical protein